MASRSMGQDRILNALGVALATIGASIAGAAILNLGAHLVSGGHIRPGSLSENGLIGLGGVVGVWALVPQAYPTGWRMPAAVTIAALNGVVLALALPSSVEGHLRTVETSILSLLVAAVLIWPFKLTRRTARLA